LGNKVASLIELNQAAITGVVIAELLQGVKHEKENQRLRVLLSSIHYLQTEDSDWMNAGKLAAQLRAKGLTLPLTDVLIATVAQRNQVSVLTIDKHFHHLGVDLVRLNEE
jgi:predicted nucleic acid-binding protein